MKALYEAKGYPKAWIDKRLRGIAVRDALTDEWKDRGVKEYKEYVILTAEISKAMFGLTPSEYRSLKGLKTVGVRQVEICPALKKILLQNKTKTEDSICPPNWDKSWRTIRDESGFKGVWVQDVLRHTYASLYTKRFSDLPKLQLNVGHRDLSLLRSRYVNMYGISKRDAKTFLKRQIEII